MAAPTLGLRVRDRDVWLTIGTYTIGRHPDCQFVLGDGLVSRHHARLVVDAQGLMVEDLGSANGVLVNGKKLGVGPSVLVAGDRFVIGGAELEVIEASAEGDSEQRRSRRHEEVDTQPGGPDVSVRVFDGPQMSPSDATGRIDSLEVLAMMVKKAITARRLAESEESLAPQFRNALATARRGPLREGVLDDVAGYALKLAVATRSGAWFDFVIDIHEAQGKPFSGAVLVDLQVAAEHVAVVDLARLESCIASWEGKRAGLGQRGGLLVDRARELFVTLRGKSPTK